MTEEYIRVRDEMRQKKGQPSLKGTEKKISSAENHGQTFI